ncbi:UNVERIFIED_CONTAM: Prolyl 4-hydroxylase 1 [Sesamum latifolium]|uniref:Prolyl 4-hydroxylase 1 n=1 Tax=Sesamum latifolium TaxID=2727402 RepID=A0AAW2XQN9_9LAMI
MAEDRNSHVIQAIERRISIYTHVPVENGEFLQVIRYKKHQYYKPHYDYFEDPINLMHWGQRIATMLMYLSDNVEGGETHFPEVGSGECSCGGKVVKGLCVRPVKGDALLFWNTGLDGEVDPSSLHGGCEVLAGEKWSATKWMRQKALHFN